MKNKLVKVQSIDGEIHFHECNANWCNNLPEYNIEQARIIAKKEAEKPLLLKRNW